MVKYKRFCLENGLRVLVHEDRSTPLVAMNLLYDVGSRDEDPGSTGLAHLFEHLMFGGTLKIPEYDKHLQLAGGENNAFTNSDFTNYYLTLPSENIETGFWLESDRMNEPGFSQKTLDIQKKVVTEEFHQRYINQPYGDVMLLLKPMAYKFHPYRWPTIGMDSSHIENVKLSSVKDFFHSHYAPNNAILTLTGNIKPHDAIKLTLKWFGPVKKRKLKKRRILPEPGQTAERKQSVKRDVPSDALYKVWHSCNRKDEDFYTLDVITDILAGGESGRLSDILVKEKKLFSDINAYLTSEIDPGLVILHGKLMKGVDIQQADEAVEKVIGSLKEKYIPPSELEKIRNKFESSALFANTNILNKAMGLAFYELLGDPEMINREVALFRNVDRKMVLETSRKYLTKTNCSTLYYKKSGKN
jgi:predicted Zn-dependent peptidase